MELLWAQTHGPGEKQNVSLPIFPTREFSLSHVWLLFCWQNTDHCATNMNYSLTFKINFELTESNRDGWARNKQRSTRIFHAEYTWICSFQNHRNFFQLFFVTCFLSVGFLLIFNNYNTSLYGFKDRMTAWICCINRMSLESITRMSRILSFAKFTLLVWVFGNNWAEKESAATFNRLYQNTNNKFLRWEENLTRNKALAGLVFQHRITISFTLFFQNIFSLFISCSKFKLQCSHKLKLQQTSFILDKPGITSLLSVHRLSSVIHPLKKCFHKRTFHIQTLFVLTQFSLSGSAAYGGCFLRGFNIKMILNAKNIRQF